MRMYFKISQSALHNIRPSSCEKIYNEVIFIIKNFYQLQDNVYFSLYLDSCELGNIIFLSIPMIFEGIEKKVIKIAYYLETFEMSVEFMCRKKC